MTKTSNAKIDIPSILGETIQTFRCQDVPTCEHHRGVGFCRLLFGDGACEYRVISVFWRNRNFDLRKHSQDSQKLKQSKAKKNPEKAVVLTGSSSVAPHSLFLSCITFFPFSIRTSAPPPPISPTARSGGCRLICSIAQYSVANCDSRFVWTEGSARSAYGEFASRASGRKTTALVSRAISDA